ncbi:MAG: hypothetical protein AAF514_03020 [Verrucomicrobiota bacterium]
MKAPICLCLGLIAGLVSGFFFGQTVPQAARPEVRSHPLHGNSPTLLPKTLSTQSGSSTEAKETDGENQVSAASMEAISSLAKRRTYQDPSMYAEIVQVWMAKDPLGCLDYLAVGENEDAMRAYLFQVWGQQDPEAASTHLSAQPSSPRRDAAIEGLVRTIARTNPESALRWAEAIVNPSTQIRVWAQGGFEHYRNSHSEANALLEESPLPPASKAAIRQAWQSSWTASLQRKSQNLTAVANAARAMGVELSESLPEMVEQLAAGVTASDGTIFNGGEFTEQERMAIGQWVEITEQQIVYHPSKE